MSEKQRQKKAGARKDKKNRGMRQDVAARGRGATAKRPRTKTGAAKSARPGRTKGKGGAGSPTHKGFRAAELARVERPARGRQAR